MATIVFTVLKPGLTNQIHSAKCLDLPWKNCSLFHVCQCITVPSWKDTSLVLTCAGGGGGGPILSLTLLHASIIQPHSTPATYEQRGFLLPTWGEGRREGGSVFIMTTIYRQGSHQFVMTYCHLSQRAHLTGDATFVPLSHGTGMHKGSNEVLSSPTLATHCQVRC